MDSYESICRTGAVLCRNRLQPLGVKHFQRHRYRPKQVAAGLDNYVYLATRMDLMFLRYRVERGIHMVAIGFDRNIVQIPGARVMNGNGLRFCHRDALMGGSTYDGNGGWLYPEILSIPQALPLYPWAKSVVCLTYSSNGPHKSPMDVLETSTLVS
jgi:hypothetical protein